MPNNCAKNVYNLWPSRGTTCAYESTTSTTLSTNSLLVWVKVVIHPLFIRVASTVFSTVKITYLTPTEHYLYPVSTGPIIRFTNLKKGRNN